MIRIEKLQFSYPGAGFRLHIPQFQVASGESLAIIGPSGIGKTTLLKLIAGIFAPQSGELQVDGKTLQRMSETERRSFRIRRIGFVFQELELLEYLQVWDNILHTYRINPVLRIDQEVLGRLEDLAQEVGLADKLKRMPHELSQGERQRVAICRALLPEPGLILADEATGNLDPRNKTRILQLLLNSTAQRQASLLMVTHDHELLGHFDRVVDLMQFHA